MTFVGSWALFRTIAERKLRSADKKAELEAKTAADEDAARKDFRNELRATIQQLYTEIGYLRTAHEACQEHRLQDREELAYLRGQVELLTGRVAVVPKSILQRRATDSLVPHGESGLAGLATKEDGS